MRKKPNIRERKIIATSRLFQIEEIDVAFSNGESRIFERLTGRRHGAVMIIPMLDDETVLLAREYAAGVDRYELGLPKGLIEPGETPLEAANREMMEEIGYGARKLKQLKHMSAAPGYMSSTMELILARDLYEEQRQGDEPEAIEVVPWRLSDLYELVQQHDFTEARSIAALFLIRELIDRGEIE